MHVQQTILYFYSGPDDTVDDLDFSLFRSYDNVLYDALGDLSFDDDNIVIDVSDCAEMEEHSIARFARGGGVSASTLMANRVARFSLWTTIRGCGMSAGS